MSLLWINLVGQAPILRYGIALGFSEWHQTGLRGQAPFALEKPFRDDESVKQNGELAPPKGKDFEKGNAGRIETCVHSGRLPSIASVQLVCTWSSVYIGWAMVQMVNDVRPVGQSSRHTPCAVVSNGTRSVPTTLENNPAAGLGSYPNVSSRALEDGLADRGRRGAPVRPFISPGRNSV